MASPGAVTGVAPFSPPPSGGQPPPPASRGRHGLQQHKSGTRGTYRATTGPPTSKPALPPAHRATPVASSPLAARASSDHSHPRRHCCAVQVARSPAPFPPPAPPAGARSAQACRRHVPAPGYLRAVWSADARRIPLPQHCRASGRRRLLGCRPCAGPRCRRCRGGPPRPWGAAARQERWMTP